MSKYIFALKKSMLSSRYVPEFEFEDLVRFFISFPFLLNSRIEYYETPNCEMPFHAIKIYIYGECLDMGHMVLEFNEQVNYLYSVSISDPRNFSDENKTKSQRIVAEYMPFSKSGEFEIIFSNEPIAERVPRTIYICYKKAVEDFLREFRMLTVHGENEDYFFRDFFFVDNKYIKYLALTISDLINAESKRKVYEHFSARYSSVFVRLSGAHIIRWDEIFVFLLLEVGIYKLLVYLFRNTNLNYTEVKEAFRLRFGESVTRLEEEYEIIRDPLSGLLLRNANSIINCKVQALILLATRLLTANEVKISLEDSLASIIEVMDDLKAVSGNSSLQADEKILYFANKLVNFNSFIVIFYEGLLSCYDKSKVRDLEESARLIFSKYESVFAAENTSFFRHATLQMRRFISDKCNDIYKIKTLNREAMDKLCTVIDDSFALLRELNRSLNARNTSRNEQFYDMVGRRKLFDESIFQTVSSGLLAAFNACKEERANVRDIYEAFIQYLLYMRNGSLDANAPIEGAIYPIVGTCSQTVMSQDGYRYSYFSVDTGKGETRLDIKIISNETMNIGEVYYCVPNIRRCLRVPAEREKEKYIWINPQIIPYEVFQPNTEAVFGPLKQKADYKKAAELIYLSDEKVYKNLFGNSDNAVKVLSVLFEKGRSIYNKKYVYTLSVPQVNGDEEGEIIAVATLYPDLPEWDENVIISAFYAAGVSVTENTYHALESIKDTFNDTIGNNYYISDLCVNEKYRGDGYAKFMLNNLVRVAEKDIRGKNVVLSVYEDNVAALNLYNVMGFIPYVAGYDNRGEEKTRRERYYKMIKYI